MQRTTMARVLLAMALFSGLACIASAQSTGRVLLNKKTTNTKPKNVPGLPELETRNLCISNTAFDYTVWAFRKGYKNLCCAYCAAGSMENICKNVYDRKGAMYYACSAPESYAPCTDVAAPIPPKPICPEDRPGYTADNSLPELETRDLCRSHTAFDYNVWKFRKGYKNLCCAYCASGSMEVICKNVYDIKGNRYNACAETESPAPCTNPNAPIPTGPVCPP